MNACDSPKLKAESRYSQTCRVKRQLMGGPGALMGEG